MKEHSSLRMAIISWGLMGVIGIPLLVWFDPVGGWKWEPYNSIYDQMIVSLYVVLGIFCFLSLTNPLKHAQFLWFVVWSSVAHGVVMLWHALHSQVHRGHLLGDVWILAGAIALAIPLWQAERTSKAAQQVAAADGPPGRR